MNIKLYIDAHFVTRFISNIVVNPFPVNPSPIREKMWPGFRTMQLRYVSINSPYDKTEEIEIISFLHFVP